MTPAERCARWEAAAVETYATQVAALGETIQDLTERMADTEHAMRLTAKAVHSTAKILTQKALPPEPAKDPWYDDFLENNRGN